MKYLYAITRSTRALCAISLLPDDPVVAVAASEAVSAGAFFCSSRAVLRTLSLSMTLACASTCASEIVRVYMEPHRLNLQAEACVSLLFLVLTVLASI